MGTYNTVIKKRNAANTGWDSILPITTAENVLINEQGDTVATHMAEKASDTNLGHVKVDGTTITVNENGVISGGGEFIVGSFTRSTTTASGTQAITGVGFKPKFIIFFATVTNVASRMSVGITDGTNGGCITDVNAGTGTANAYAASIQNIFMRQGSDSAYSYYGSVQSMDDDGFTINWTKGATAVDGETITVRYLAGR